MATSDTYALFLVLIGTVAFLFYARLREYVYAAAAGVGVLLGLFVLIGPLFVDLDRSSRLGSLIVAPLFVLVILLSLAVQARSYKDVWREYRRRKHR